MERFARMLSRTSSVDESQQFSQKKRSVKSAYVDEIRNDQLENPYTEIQLLQHHTDIVRHLLKVGDNCCLSAGDDGNAVLWDITLGRKLLVLHGHTRPITCALLLESAASSFTEDSVLITGSSDRQIRVWIVTTGESIHLLTEHQSSVKCLVSMRDGNFFISGGEILSLWSSGGLLLNTNRLDSETGSVNFMIVIKNERIVIALEKQLVVYQLTDQSCGDEKGPRLFFCTKLLPHREAVNSLVNINGATFASGSLDGTVVLWGAHTLSRCRNFNSKPEYQDSLKSYPFSVQYMFGMEEHYIFAAIGSGFFVYDLSGQILAEKTHAHYNKIMRMGFVYNGEFLATCSEDGAIRLWGCSSCIRKQDAKTGTVERFLGVKREDFSQLRGDNPPVEPLLVGECLGHSGAVFGMSDFGAEGFVSCGADNLVILWRDGMVQSLKRTEIARELVIGATAAE